MDTLSPKVQAAISAVMDTESSVMLVLVVSKNYNAKVAHGYITIANHCKQPLEPVSVAAECITHLGDELAGFGSN